MNAMCGILGKRDASAVRAMARAMKHRADAVHLHEGDGFSVAAASAIADPVCLIDGIPRRNDGSPMPAHELQRTCAAVPGPAQLSVRGAFAAAVRVDGSWWLLRDRLGVKPLYYAEMPDCLVFASELKGLLASGYIKRHLNLASVDRYLTLRCVPGEESILQGVRRVLPGHVVEYARGAAKDFVFAGYDLNMESRSRDEAAQTFRTLLGEAAGRVESETLLWSAGIDCAALGVLKPEALPVFVTLKSGWQAEAWKARESARLLGRPWNACKAATFQESIFGKAAHALDEPIADPSVLPLWLIAEQLGGTASSAISGHGADEMLGGYPRYHFMQKAHGARKLVPVNFISELAPALPPNALIRRGGQYLTSIRDNLDAYLSLLAVFGHDEREQLYTDAMKSVMHEKGGSASVMRPHFGDRDLTRNLLALGLNVGIPDLLLAKCDRIMAAHGVALEFPYLDDAVVDFAISLPTQVKFGVRSKPVLRQAMKGLLPGRIRLRARRDFKVPQSGPALRVIENAAQQIVTQERVEATGLFKWPYVEQVMRSSSHNVYRRRQFWALLMFFAWYREIMEV